MQFDYSLFFKKSFNFFFVVVGEDNRRFVAPQNVDGWMSLLEG